MRKKMRASNKSDCFLSLLLVLSVLSSCSVASAAGERKGVQQTVNQIFKAGSILSGEQRSRGTEGNAANRALSGKEVAEKVTQRYSDTQKVCAKGKAAFYCHGVLLRVTDAGDTWHAWNPGRAAIKRNGVSFYYLSADNGIKKLNYTSVGLIFSELEASPQYTLIARCAYPSNGYSDARSDSCNARRGYPKSAPCAKQGIDTIDKWVKHYRNSGNGKYQCSFKTDKQAFNLSQDVRNYFPRPSDRVDGNEMVFAAWPQDIPDQLALDAVFYQNRKDIEKAQYIQKDFYKETHKILPVLYVDLSAPDDQKFTWHAEDQAVK